MNAHDATLMLHKRGVLDATARQLESLRDGSMIDGTVYSSSLFLKNRELHALARLDDGKRLLIIAKRKEPGEGFAGEVIRGHGFICKSCPLTPENATALRRQFPWTAPTSLAKRKTTFGCGDRLGRATPGHLRAATRFMVSPVLAQQSIRELTLTGRTFQGVVDDVTFLVFQAGYTDGYGADADHLKTLEHIGMAIDSGMTMITLDLSEVMRPQVASMSPAQVDAEFRKLSAPVQAATLKQYAGQTFRLKTAAGEATIEIDEPTAKLCAAMYTPALDFARQVFNTLVSRLGEGNFDLEMSIDETTTPTLPAHHLYIVRELIRRGVVVVSLAPRFIGEFQKGIDYIGDLAEFERQFTVHTIIAQSHGDYKISVHSGSDKFSIFPTVGRITGGRFHEKTAGTSWLEAVRLVAAKAPALYRRFHETALRRLPDAQKLYHITPDLSRIPKLDTLKDADLPKLMEQNEARQVLHVTYGFILEDEAMRTEFFEALDRHEEDYYQLLDRHFTRHMEGLGIPRR